MCAHLSKYEVSIFVPLWLVELGATSHTVRCGIAISELDILKKRQTSSGHVSDAQ